MTVHTFPSAPYQQGVLKVLGLPPNVFSFKLQATFEGYVLDYVTSELTNGGMPINNRSTDYIHQVSYSAAWAVGSDEAKAITAYFRVMPECAELKVWLDEPHELLRIQQTYVPVEGSLG